MPYIFTNAPHLINSVSLFKVQLYLFFLYLSYILYSCYLPFRFALLYNLLNSINISEHPNIVIVHTKYNIQQHKSNVRFGNNNSLINLIIWFALQESIVKQGAECSDHSEAKKCIYLHAPIRYVGKREPNRVKYG